LGVSPTLAPFFYKKYMALTPTLSFTVRNDNKLITITDTTVDYNIGGNISVAGIATLTLDVEYTNSSNVTTTYNTIDLYSLFGPFVVQNDLIFELNPSHLIVGSTAMGDADSEFLDGIYYFTYTINTIEAVKEYDVLLDGRVVNATYELLRMIPQYYLFSSCNNKEILDAIFTMAMIDSMESSAYVGNDEAILEQLSVIERLVTNGSNYTW
jgi:hypothetical protein